MVIRERVAWQNTNFTIIDGEKINPQDTPAEETVIEYVGPKRLPRIIKVGRGEVDQQTNPDNIIIFVRKK